MFETIKALLASSDPATLIGSATAAVFLLILSWRKLHPRSWNWLEAHIPWIDKIQSDALWTFAWKAMQAIPGTLFGAAMTALASGGDLKKTLLGALAGPAAAIGHEVLKRYKGEPSKPGSRSLPPPPLVGACFVLAILICACASGQSHVCDPADAIAPTADYAAKVHASCQGYTFDACPARPALEASLKKQHEAACPTVAQ